MKGGELFHGSVAAFTVHFGRLRATASTTLEPLKNNLGRVLWSERLKIVMRDTITPDDTLKTESEPTKVINLKIISYCPIRR